MRKTSTRCLGALLLALGWLVAGCATSPVRGALLGGFGLHSGPGALRRAPLAHQDGSGGGEPGPWAPEAQPREEWEKTWEEAVSRCVPGVLPAGWPRQARGEGEALLAPFLECASAGDFVSLQERLDMPLLLERLGPWDAVRLGALGKQLRQTLGSMPQVCQELEERGLSLSSQPERDFQWSDVGRGLGRAARDALSTSAGSDGSRYMDLSLRRQQVPPPYQRALDEVEHALALQHFAPGQVVLGGFDTLTFGVPLGFYGLVAGTGQGLSSLAQGEYEQATRQLAPAALLVAVHTGVRGVGSLAEARGLPGSGRMGLRGLPELRLSALRDMAGQLEARLGVEGLRELAGHLRARREAGEWVAVGGVDAALALHEARGDLARAQAWMSQAQRPGKSAGAHGAARLTPPRPPAPRESLAALVDEGAGLTPEVLRAKLAGVEGETAHVRLPSEVALLERQQPVLGAPPPGAHGKPRWAEYVTYYAERLDEIRQGKTAKGPLPWSAYEQLRGWFARGLAFERVMVELLRADAAMPRAQRRWLQDFDSPRVEAYVGVWKPESGLRFADVLVIEQRPPPAGQTPRVETFSFKSRDLSELGDNALRAQMVADAREALGYYGETLDIRRPSLQLLVPKSGAVPVQRVRLFYAGGELNPGNVKSPKAIVKKAEKAVPGVEVLLQ